MTGPAHAIHSLPELSGGPEKPDVDAFGRTRRERDACALALLGRVFSLLRVKTYPSQISLIEAIQASAIDDGASLVDAWHARHMLTRACSAVSLAASIAAGLGRFLHPLANHAEVFDAVRKCLEAR